MIHLDTHIAIWLYEGLPGRLTAAARERLVSEACAFSPMAALELSYLNEVDRLKPTAETILADLQQSIGLTMSTAPFALVVRHAQPLTWTRDPFDRLIVATALADGADLVTADRRIREQVPTAVWD